MGQRESTPVDDSVPPRSLSARTLSAVAEYINGGRGKSIVVLTGAGISTAAGIPDFRSPKTGLYNNLARLNLPYAEAVFDIDYFRQHPEPFYILAQELYPGKFHPTVSHAFIALLARKGLLRMLFTQNIDCLERAAGIPADKIVEAHGSFATQRCIDCKTVFPDDEMREHVLNGRVPHCIGAGCNGTVKPDIVFFGESLPQAFSQNSHQTAMADLVLILGTSLTVYPFAGLPEMAREDTPRVLFNMERVGRFGGADDVVELGSCDSGIRKLADALGWKDELERLWRDLVGENEAERQLRSQERHEEEVQDEVQKLAEAVGAALKLEETDEGQDDRADGRGVGAARPEESDPDNQGAAPHSQLRKWETGNDEQVAPLPETAEEESRGLTAGRPASTKPDDEPRWSPLGGAEAEVDRTDGRGRGDAEASTLSYDVGTHSRDEDGTHVPLS